MNGVFLKRRYLDLRLGGVTINPLIQASNFTMLAYLTMENIVPMWIFIPLFIIGVFSLFGVVGLFFRRIQLSTDEDLKYEKQIELNKTLYQIMLALSKQKQDLEFYQRMDEVKNIIDNK